MAVKIDHNKCIKCTGCVGICPVGALKYEGGQIVVDKEKCIECGQCVKFCPVRAPYLKNKEKKEK